MSDLPFFTIKQRLEMPFEPRTYQIGFDQVLYYDDKERIQKLNIASLQRMSLYAQQNNLLERVEKIIRAGGLITDDEVLLRTMQNYGIF